MPLSPHVAGLRRRIGSDLLLLPSVTGIVYDDASRVLLVRQSAILMLSAAVGVAMAG